MKNKIIGQESVEGKLCKFTGPIEVRQLGNKLYCKNGICWR
jgi:hypothetical protein